MITFSLIYLVGNKFNMFSALLVSVVLYNIINIYSKKNIHTYYDQTKLATTYIIC